MSEAKPQDKSEAASTDFKDRGTWLAAVGIGELIIAGLTLLAAPLTLLGFVAISAAGSTGDGSTGAQMSLFVAGSLIVSGLFLGAVGWGTLKAARWARALMVVVARTWLVLGVLDVVLASSAISGVLETVLEGTAWAAARTVARTLAVGLVSTVCLVLPAFLAVFYNLKDVRKTVEAKHEQESWPERCPRSVLAVSICCASTSVLCLLFLSFGVAPFFGFVASGIAGRALILIYAVAAAFLAVAVYRRHPWGWYGIMGLTLFGSASNTITVLRVDAAALISHAQSGGGDPELVRAAIDALPLPLSALSVIFAVAILLYLLWVRHFFSFPTKPTSADAPSSEAEAKP